MAKPGDQYVVRLGDASRLDRAAALNARAGAHLWTVIASYGLTDQEAANAAEGVQQLLDKDHLLALIGIGCYLCEEPYEEVAGKPCKGDPGGLS